ncbi:integrating conjugative element protein [uncultured Halomonas sp.]|uniref:integrating conjugative element protein n=1 Tax=uncultured Halomonas sp. TaxID=173971 RepID=UPI002632C1CE|nr:integrating conjugative element protein [uncultured Halomonas sp.]
MVILPVIPLIIALALPLTSQAQVYSVSPSSPDNSWLYYEIGGGQAFTRAPNPVVNSVTLGAGAELGMGYSCAAFNPVVSVTNQLNQLRDGVDALSNQMAGAANAAIAALPAYILQRANPGLYDLFQNALLRAEERFQLATKTCEQMEAEIAQGKDPFQEWVVLSKGHSWRKAMGTGGVNGDGDIVTTKTAIEQNPGKDGLPWLDGRRGGAGQPPIRVVTDVVRAGYNIIAERPPHAGGTAFSTTDPTAPPMARYWTSPMSAAEWAVRLLGDEDIPTCHDANCPPRQSTPGMGLTRLVQETRSTLLPDLYDLVNGSVPLSTQNLSAVSTPGMPVTPDLIRSLRELPPAEQFIAVGRLADEIALAANVERALYLRRFFMTGRMVPEINTHGPARQAIEIKVAELEREIENTLFENRVRQELVSHTARTLLQHDAQRRADSRAASPGARPDPRPLEDGAVTP